MLLLLIQVKVNLIFLLIVALRAWPIKNLISKFSKVRSLLDIHGSYIRESLCKNVVSKYRAIAPGWEIGLGS